MFWCCREIFKINTADKEIVSPNDEVTAMRRVSDDNTTFCHKSIVLASVVLSPQKSGVVCCLVVTEIRRRYPRFQLGTDHKKVEKSDYSTFGLLFNYGITEHGASAGRVGFHECPEYEVLHLQIQTTARPRRLTMTVIIDLHKCRTVMTHQRPSLTRVTRRCCYNLLVIVPVSCTSMLRSM